MRIVAVLWFSLVALVALLTASLIRRWLWPRRLRRRLLLPLAVAERCLADALGELCGRDVEAQEAEEVFVSAFEPLVLRLARVSEADLVSLGSRAVENRRRLVGAIRAWNAAAGRTLRPAALLPTVLAAHQAARELSEQLDQLEQGAELQQIRAEASERILFSLVAPVDPPEGWTH
jgi:hypothetical protein